MSKNVVSRFPILSLYHFGTDWAEPFQSEYGNHRPVCANEFQSVQRAHRGDDVGRIGALPTTGFEQVSSFEEVEHLFEKQFFGTSIEQACSKVAQDGKVKPRIIQFEAECVFPIDASADGIGRLAISQVFGELHHGNQG